MFSRESYTLNFDGSHNNQATRASAGCIIRDSKGDLVVAASYNLNYTNLPDLNVAIAEAIGLRNGLKLANKHSLKLAFIKGDSQQVIDLLVLSQARRRTGPGPPLSDIIVEIKALITSQGSAEVKLINREDNKVADKFATLGSSLQTEYKVYSKYDPLPSPVTELIRQDKMKETNDGEGSSGLATMGGLAIAAGVLAFGASMFFSGGSSSASNDQQQAKRITKNAYNPPRPTPDTYTLQYFGSDRNQLQKARAGCIIFKNRREFFVAAAYNLNPQYPNCHIAIAEAIALKNGLKLAKEKNVRLNSIQGRNVEVRDRVLGRDRRPARLPDLSTFIQQIKDALYEQEVDLEDTLELVDEDRIKVARALATVGGTLDQEAVIYQSVHGLTTSVADLLDLMI